MASSTASNYYYYKLFKLFQIYIFKDHDKMMKNYEKAKTELLNHAKKLCQTAQQITSVTNQSRNKQTIGMINHLTKNVS